MYHAYLRNKKVLIVNQRINLLYLLDLFSYITGYPKLNPLASLNIERKASKREKIITNLTHSCLRVPLEKILSGSEYQ